MKRINAFFLVVVACLSANFTWANSGHFAVDDASITPGGNCSMDSWVSRVDSVNMSTVSPKCNFTGGSEWELPLVYDLDSGHMAYMGLNYKTVWWDNARGPALAFDTGFLYDRRTRKFDSYYVNIPASLQVMENVTMHLNGGVRHDRVPSDTYATWGLAATIKTISGPLLIMEYSDNDEHDPLFGFGARFRLGVTQWTLDLGVARDTGPGENIFTIGLNIPRFF